MAVGWLGRRELLDQCLHPQDLHHSFQVVGQNGKADFAAGAAQATQQEARKSQDAVLQRGERMLGTTSPPAHGLRAGPLLHAHQRVFIKVTIHRTARRWRAQRF